MAELLVLNRFEEVDERQFLNIFKESSVENAGKWYPELEEAEALQQYENGFIGYMRTDFWREGGKLFILSDGNDYVCSLRLFEKAPQEYYLEALETNPSFRLKGYAKELLFQLQQYLKKRHNDYVITAHVAKTNAASLNTHRAAGFIVTADYVVEDGERYDGDYQLTYRG